MELILPQITELNGYGKLSETGWELDPKNLDDWRNHIGAFLHADGRYKSAKQWCLGDCFNALKWGEKKPECERLGLNYEYIKKCCSIAAKFKSGSRNPLLSFGHHSIVAYVEDEQTRDNMLKTVVKNKLTLNDLRQMLEEYRLSQLPDSSPQKHEITAPEEIITDEKSDFDADLIQPVNHLAEQVEYEPPPEPKPAWTDDELKKWDELCSGCTVLANRHTHVNIIEKAKRQGKFVYIGRGMHSIGWGNPFEIGKDGDRDEVCDLYEKYFWMKKSLYNNIEKLKGKLVVCSCTPERCHGDFLVKIANGEK